MDTGSQIYEKSFVSGLFSEMSKTYGIVNYLSSFGFTERWRSQCAQQLNVPEGAVVYDLMTGMGEMFPHILARSKPKKIFAVDFCPEMCRVALAKTSRFGQVAEIIQMDVLSGGLDAESADFVFASFGLKTFSEAQRGELAKETFRILKPGGQYSFMEISVPRSSVIRLPFMFYLKFVIPMIGRLFMGNPANYRMLGVYTEKFGSCESVVEQFRAVGLEANLEHYFFGCMSLVKGRKLS